MYINSVLVCWPHSRWHLSHKRHLLCSWWAVNKKHIAASSCLDYGIGLLTTLCIILIHEKFWTGSLLHFIFRCFCQLKPEPNFSSLAYPLVCECEICRKLFLYDISYCKVRGKEQASHCVGDSYGKFEPATIQIEKFHELLWKWTHNNMWSTFLKM